MKDRVLLIGYPEINGQVAYDLIIGAILGNEVCLNARVDVSWREKPELRRKIRELLVCLEEERILRRWGYPHQTRDNTASHLIIIRENEYKDLLKEAHDISSALYAHLVDHLKATDKTALRVLTRSYGVSLALASHLKAFSLIGHEDVARICQKYIGSMRHIHPRTIDISRTIDVEFGVIHEITKMLGINTKDIILKLDANDILELRDNSKYYRRKVMELLDRSSEDTSEDIKRIAQQLMLDVCEAFYTIYSREAVHKKVRRALVGEAITTILSIICPPAKMAVLAGKLAYNAIKGKEFGRKYAHIAFVFRLILKSKL